MEPLPGSLVNPATGLLPANSRPASVLTGNGQIIPMETPYAVRDESFVHSISHSLLLSLSHLAPFPSSFLSLSLQGILLPSLSLSYMALEQIDATWESTFTLISKSKRKNQLGKRSMFVCLCAVFARYVYTQFCICFTKFEGGAG